MHELDFEKLPEAHNRGLIRLQRGGSTLVFEFREQTHWDRHVVFHRADARLLWVESGSDLNAPRTSGFVPAKNAVQVLVDTQSQSATFGPRGNILMTERGCGLGTVLMSAVVDWLMKHYPDVEVKRGSLSEVDATDENRERRNRFYRKHGFDVILDDKQAGGSFSKARAGELKVPVPRAKVLALDGFVQDFAKARSAVVKLDRANEAKGEALKSLRVAIAGHRRATLVGCLVIGLFIAFPAIPEFVNRLFLSLFMR